MNKGISIILAAATLLWSFTSVAAQETSITAVTNYRSTFRPLYTKAGELRIAVRHFKKNQQESFLVVDPYSFKTAITPVNQLSSRNEKRAAQGLPGYFTWAQLKNTPYIQSLLKYTQYSGHIQGSGLNHALTPKAGFFLSVDMCPSARPFEKAFFQKLVDLHTVQHQAFPVAISISGLWLLDHQQEFQWLLEQQRKNNIAITWVNHSFSHLYFADKPLEENFLLFELVNQKDEIYATEIALIEAGQTPSILIRLPGLVADQALLKKLRTAGLIPLAADAWLAKGEKPVAGSIVLVHGNGNEHPGIVKAFPYLNDWHNHWLPITQALL